MKRSVRKAIFMFVSLLLVFASPALASAEQKIDLNTATVQELTQLNGIGENLAKRIVAYRDENGKFKTPEEIINVKGIGNSTFEKNRDRITVSTGAEK